ncbi:MAG: AAA family ATPase [Armatimonadota bacterium]
MSLLRKEQIYSQVFNGKEINGTTLAGGAQLGTLELPKMAAGRIPGEQVRLSFALALAIKETIINKEISNTSFLFTGTDANPTGVRAVSRSQGFPLWSYLCKDTSGAGTLHLTGKPMSGSMFSFYAGYMVAAYMIMNHKHYDNFVQAYREAITAYSTGADTAIAFACAADELGYAMEKMLEGADPTGIARIEMSNTEPSDMHEVTRFSEQFEKALVDEVELDKLLTIKTTLNDKAYDDIQIPTKFVGDLPILLHDAFTRAKHVLMTGPTATGKTSCVDDVQRFMGAPISYIGGSAGLEDRDLIGSWVPDGTGALKFVDGPIVEALRNGQKQHNLAQSSHQPVPPAILMVDEINRLEERYQNIFITLLNERPDDNGGKQYYFRVPETNEELTCPVQYLSVVGARNFGSSYVGTNQMDLALERRFDIKIDIDYLEPKAEAELVMSRTGLDQITTNALIKTASDTRNQIAQLRAPIDTDTLLKWVDELVYAQSKGVIITDKTILDVAEKVVFDIVLDRTDRGQFDPAARSIMIDNITESWKEATRSA